MSSGAIPVIKFLFREDFKVLNEALSIRTVYDIEEFDAANDLATYLSTIPAGLVVISLRDKTDLVQVATLMKTMKKVANTTAVKVVIINFSGEAIYENAIAKLGIQDSIDTSINTKALKFKLDFWMKSLKGQIKNLPGQTVQKAVKPENGKEAEKKSDLLLAPQWEEALKLEDDIWILKSDNDCKKILSKYLIRMLGPGPGVGQWVEIRHGLWRFDIVESEKEMYISGKGSWFFTGEQKPEFVWKETTWMMTGHNFELFYKDGSSVYSRLKFKNKILEIAKNSVYARTKETIIIESFNKDLIFKKEADSLENLKGKNKTEKLNHDPLSGDVESTAKESGNLSGDVNGEEALSNYWGGKLAGNKANKTNGNLEGARSEVEHQTHYKGKSKKSDTDNEMEESFYKGKISTSNPKLDPDKLAEAFKQAKPQDSASKTPSNVLPFLTIALEKELADITEDAEVISHLVLNDKKVECTLDDYFDDTVIFHTNDKDFKIPLDVKLDLIYKTIVTEKNLKIEGNVITIESDGEGDNFVTIQISHEQASKLSSFMENFEKRQKNINEFMKKVKGH